jgi:hypothetical protein
MNVVRGTWYVVRHKNVVRGACYVVRRRRVLWRLASGLWRLFERTARYLDAPRNFSP